MNQIRHAWTAARLLMTTLMTTTLLTTALLTTTVLTTTLLTTTGTPAWAEDEARSATTQAGQEVQIGSHTSFDKKCRAAQMPNITVTAPPANGTVTLRPGKKVVAASAGSANCNGRELPAVLIIYRPKPGFHGTDTVSFTTDWSSRRLGSTVTITVQ